MYLTPGLLRGSMQSSPGVRAIRIILLLDFTILVLIFKAKFYLCNPGHFSANGNFLYTMLPVVSIMKVISRPPKLFEATYNWVS